MDHGLFRQLVAIEVGRGRRQRRQHREEEASAQEVGGEALLPADHGIAVKVWGEGEQRIGHGGRG
jgi:hypothetical protein